MALPPRDRDGNVTPHDDPDILDEDGVFRYIPDHQIIWDDNEGKYRLSSGAFSVSGSSYPGMSIDIEKLLQRDGIDPETRLNDPDWGIVRLIVEDLRELQGQVGSDPLDDNPYHGEVWHLNNKRKKLLSLYAWHKKAIKVP